MKLTTKVVSPISLKEAERNLNNAKRLGFPRMGKAGTKRLAIVGGGPSINQHIDEIRSFDGDIWAINGAFQWCREHDIPAWFFTGDPTEKVAPFAYGARNAMVLMDCHPALFRMLSRAHVEAVPIETLAHGSTTSTLAPHLAHLRGYSELVFYGCEGSFGQNGRLEKSTHAYGNYGVDMLLQVECNGETFLTSTDMKVQVEELGDIIREGYRCFSERSGGLLAAYIKDPNINVTAGSRQMYDAILASHAEKDKRNDGEGTGGAAEAGVAVPEGGMAAEGSEGPRDGSGGVDVERVPGVDKLRPFTGKPKGILICCPPGGQVVTSKTTESLFATGQWLTKMGIDNQLSMFTAADIEEIRNLFVSVWYDTQPQFSHLLFVDADMGFHPMLIRDMIKFNKPLMGCLYARRQMPASVVGTVPDGHSIKDVHQGFMKATGLGCGVMMISREVIARILVKYPELSDTSECCLLRAAEGTLTRIIRVFDKIRTPELRLSEDMSFCHRYLECGGEIWANVDHKISHVGAFDYHLRYAGILENKAKVEAAA